MELKNGIPSHDTLCRVFGMISPDVLQQLYQKWQELLNRNEGEAIKKIICIDGKTMRSNKRKEGKPSHIVSAWSREGGFCLGQKAVDVKSNEITAIPQVLEKIRIKGQHESRRIFGAGASFLKLEISDGGGMKDIHAYVVF